MECTCEAYGEVMEPDKISENLVWLFVRLMRNSWTQNNYMILTTMMMIINNNNKIRTQNGHRIRNLRCIMSPEAQQEGAAAAAESHLAVRRQDWW